MRIQAWHTIALFISSIAAAHAGTFVQQVAPVVPGQYIVTFEEQGRSLDDLRQTELDLVRIASENGFTVKEVWRDALRGAVVSGVSDATARMLARSPGIASVSPDVIGELSTIQPNAPEGLDRISQHNLPLDGNFVYNFNGTGVHAYVLDGQIRTTHQEFGSPSRATNDFDVFGTPCLPTQTSVQHGTAVASIVGGATVGVAKNIRIHGVRVTACANGNPTTSSVVSGLNWVVAHGLHPGIVNLSLEVPEVGTAVDTAVNSAIGAGFFVVVAAGNGTGDACNVTPARVPGALTVAASHASTDARASFSNFGSCVDLYAPSGVPAATASNDVQLVSNFTGTSASAPHATGAAALLFQSASPYIPPASSMQVVIKSYANPRIIGVPSGTTKLLFSNGIW